MLQGLLHQSAACRPASGFKLSEEAAEATSIKQAYGAACPTEATLLVTVTSGVTVWAAV